MLKFPPMADRLVLGKQLRAPWTKWLPVAEQIVVETSDPEGAIWKNQTKSNLCCTSEIPKHFCQFGVITKSICKQYSIPTINIRDKTNGYLSDLAVIVHVLYFSVCIMRVSLLLTVISGKTNTLSPSEFDFWWWTSPLCSSLLEVYWSAYNPLPPATLTPVVPQYFKFKLSLL